MKPADPTWWCRITRGPDKGDMEQQDRRYMLRRMVTAGGSTAAWVLYIDGVPHEQRKTLREAKAYAQKLSAKLIARERGVDGKTITNEQIRALALDPRASLQVRAWCGAALRVTGGSRRAEVMRDAARVRVADEWNALHGDTEKDGDK